MTQCAGKVTWTGSNNPHDHAAGQGLAGAFERVYFLTDLGVHNIQLPVKPLALCQGLCQPQGSVKADAFHATEAVNPNDRIDVLFATHLVAHD
jgi:hypothetical protein